jgi:hypothetical protein
VAVVTVEQVKGRAAYKRFVEFPYLAFRDEPRWSAPLAAYERSRLDPHHPYFDQGDGEFFLARRAGSVAGRIAAHVSRHDDPDGWFGFFDSAEDPEVGLALLQQAAEWLRGQGCTTITGPVAFPPEGDAGVLVDGFDVAGTTGRPWHPPWYAAHLEAAGLTRAADTRTWRLLAAPGPHRDPVNPPRVPMVGRFVDPRLTLPGITAVPDLTPARGSAITLARMARRREWTGCTIVTIDGPASMRVPELLAAAAAADYDWVVSPWSPDDAPPETVHARFSSAL